VCVGDSVSQVNPIVGEGYKFIFEAALIASKAIEKSLKNKDLNYLLEYESNWRKRFLLNYKRSKRSKRSNRSQARLFKYSQNNFLTDFIVFISKFLSDKRAIKTLSGEYGLDEV
jgi:digeranylgeranylglycerophospholipid reductase